MSRVKTVYKGHVWLAYFVQQLAPYKFIDEIELDEMEWKRGDDEGISHNRLVGKVTPVHPALKCQWIRNRDTNS